MATGNMARWPVNVLAHLPMEGQRMSEEKVKDKGETDNCCIFSFSFGV